MIEFIFGHDHGKSVTLKAPSLKRAIRMFYVGVPFPHVYSTAPVFERRPDRNGWEQSIALSSAPGAVVIVRSREVTWGPWTEVARIPPTSPEGDAYTPADLGPALLGGGPLAPAPTADTSTAVALVSETAFHGSTRSALEQRTLELDVLLNRLELQKRELQNQANALQAELKLRMEQVWLIELFLGSHEEVITLRTGAPAPANTRIAVHQRVLCMDEELAVFDWLEHPERIGQFDCQTLEDFDARLTQDSALLDMIIPEAKGVAALRVRRHKKERASSNLAEAFNNAKLAGADMMTYLLIRNGECLYRLWADVQLWPRMIPRDSEWERKISHFDRMEDDREFNDRTTGAMKKYASGFLVLNGLLQRSTLLHPLPAPVIDAFNSEHVAEYFTLVLDDDGRTLLGDGRAHEDLTWAGYKKWLQAQNADGVRALWTRPSRDSGSGRDEHQDLMSRTGYRSQRLNEWPKSRAVYTIAQRPDKGLYGVEFEFLYKPYRDSLRRVRFDAYRDELIPIDFLSWRVLEHLIRDRGQREHYASFFRLAFDYWAMAKAEAERERPFVDLVLTRCNVDLGNNAERARAERILRWWKLKVKEHRTLGTDEAKALRMVEAAFRNGDDHANDPEHRLLASAE